MATISAHNDATIGELVADAMEKVGAEGVVSVEEAKGTEDITGSCGRDADRSWLPVAVLHHRSGKDGGCARIASDPDFGEEDLQHQRSTSAVGTACQTRKPLLIIAEDLDGEALATLVVNKLRGNLALLAVKSPGYGDRRKAMMQDIAMLTGGTFIASELGVDSRVSS